MYLDNEEEVIAKYLNERNPKLTDYELLKIACEIHRNRIFRFIEEGIRDIGTAIHQK